MLGQQACVWPVDYLHVLDTVRDCPHPAAQACSMFRLTKTKPVCSSEYHPLCTTMQARVRVILCFRTSKSLAFPGTLPNNQRIPAVPHFLIRCFFLQFRVCVFLIEGLSYLHFRTCVFLIRCVFLHLVVLFRVPGSSAAGAAAGTKLSAAAPGGNRGEFRLSPKAAEARSSPRMSELSDQELETLFEEFGIKFEKSYENDDEKAMRFEVFKRNLKRIDEVCCRIIFGFV